MPTNEKEYNGYLFDQLSAIERIERCLNNSGEEAAKEEIAILKNEIIVNYINSHQLKLNKL